MFLQNFYLGLRRVSAAFIDACVMTLPLCVIWIAGNTYIVSTTYGDVYGNVEWWRQMFIPPNNHRFLEMWLSAKIIVIFKALVTALAPALSIVELSRLEKRTGFLILAIEVAILGFCDVVQVTSSQKATIGKRMFGLVVCSKSGNQLSVSQACLRFLTKLLTPASLGVGLIFCLMKPHKSIHDILAKSYVRNGIGTTEGIRQINESDTFSRKLMAAISICIISIIAAQCLFDSILDEKITRVKICLLPKDGEHKEQLIREWAHLAELKVRTYSGPQRLDILEPLATLCREQYGSTDGRYLNVLSLILQDHAGDNVANILRHEKFCDDLLAGARNAHDPTNIGSPDLLVPLGFLHPDTFAYFWGLKNYSLTLSYVEFIVSMTFEGYAFQTRKMNNFSLSAHYLNKSIDIQIQRQLRSPPTDDATDIWKHLNLDCWRLSDLPEQRLSAKKRYEEIFAKCIPHHKCAKKISDQMHICYERLGI